MSLQATHAVFVCKRLSETTQYGFSDGLCFLLRLRGRELDGCRTNRLQPQSASFRNIGNACVAAPHILP
ncbi:hypothetical protein [Kingella potus]|uniref:hypothetical protein n=1 Tax=Kingella potus TaxID=265175 RepID=UPI001FD5A3A1|nr:hypothetical protein [Kingella potus]UOP01058.1 hypothetical protein LVJ84_01420 [Kingella potus]